MTEVNDVREGKKITVVYISGFMTPSNLVCYPKDLIPYNVNMITVFPSPVGSLHDRVCQIFYELKGGIVDYGEEHSQFHGHRRFGKHYTQGKYPEWDDDHPIILAGHSFGGSTAWTLQNYLAKARFNGFPTSASWVTGVIAINTPLNGALQVYNKGMDTLQPTFISWLSPGHQISCLAQTIEFFSLSWVKAVFDPELEHWNLHCQHPDSLVQWLLAPLGLGVYSSSDHLAYDTSVQSQLQWHRYNTVSAETFYCSVVGNLSQGSDSSTPKPSSSLLDIIGSYLYAKLRSKPPSSVAGIDTSQWSARGGDGLLSVHTQEFPRLLPNTLRTQAMLSANHFHDAEVRLERGTWYHYEVSCNHLSAALQGRTVWTEVFRTVLKMHDEHNRLPPSLRRDKCFSPQVKSKLFSKSGYLSRDRLESVPSTHSLLSSSTTTGHSDIDISDDSCCSANDLQLPDMQEIQLSLALCHQREAPLTMTTSPHPLLITLSRLGTSFVQTTFLLYMVWTKMRKVFPEDAERISNNSLSVALKSTIFFLPIILGYIFLSIDATSSTTTSSDKSNHNKTISHSTLAEMPSTGSNSHSISKENSMDRVPVVILQIAEVLFGLMRMLLLCTVDPADSCDTVLALFYVEGVILALGFAQWNAYTVPHVKVLMAFLLDMLLQHNVNVVAYPSSIVKTLMCLSFLPVISSTVWIVTYIVEYYASSSAWVSGTLQVFQIGCNRLFRSGPLPSPAAAPNYSHLHPRRPVFRALQWLAVLVSSLHIVCKLGLCCSWYHLLRMQAQLDQEQSTISGSSTHIAVGQIYYLTSNTLLSNQIISIGVPLHCSSTTVFVVFFLVMLRLMAVKGNELFRCHQYNLLSVKTQLHREERTIKRSIHQTSL